MPTDTTLTPEKHSHIPHFDVKYTYQAITFRLADSLPASKRQEIERAIARQPESKRKLHRRKRTERWLDAGHGCCILRQPAMAATMKRALQHFDGERYHLIAWCIMPNHVHVLVQTLSPLPKTIQSWKSFTGRWAFAHASELGLNMPDSRFWMRDYWDRYIRNEQHYIATVDYIHANPVSAGLCRQPEDWPWSSASANKRATSAP